MSEKYVNVVVLNVKQQAAIHGCLFNWMQQVVLDAMDKIIVGKTDDNDVYQMLDRAMKAMVKFEKLVCLFPSILNPYKSGFKTNLFCFETSDMQLIEDAVNLHNESTVDLVFGEEVGCRITAELEGLKKAIELSKPHQFTIDEVRKIMGNK